MRFRLRRERERKSAWIELKRERQVAQLKQTFNETGVVVITRNLGMTVAQSTALRIRMRDAGASFKVSKNTLALIASRARPTRRSATC